MDKKLKEIRAGIRLDIRKPPKVEIPKNVYNRKVKHKKGLRNEHSGPFFISYGFFLFPLSGCGKRVR